VFFFARRRNSTTRSIDGLTVISSIEMKAVTNSTAVAAWEVAVRKGTTKRQMMNTDVMMRPVPPN
jgi:hypothetical protein